MPIPQFIPEELADTNPSVKLVWVAIEASDESTFRAEEIVEWTQLSEGSVYHALGTLVSMGHLDTRPDVEDPRRTLYYR